MLVMIVGEDGRARAMQRKLAREGHTVVLVPVAQVEQTNFNRADLVVISPEDPLIRGMARQIETASGVPVFGARQAPARQLEGSKINMKRIMLAAGVATAPFQTFSDVGEGLAYLQAMGVPSVRAVIKTEYPKGGHGVTIVQTLEEGEQDLRKKLLDENGRPNGEQVVIEEFLDGSELSFTVISNGDDLAVLPLACDYQKLRTNDQGPNTGGMGAYAPVPGAPSVDRLLLEIAHPVHSVMLGKHIDLRSLVYYFGLMIMPDGRIFVLECNVRFGDPEMQVMLPLLGHGFGELLLQAAQGKPMIMPPTIPNRGAVAVVLATHGYAEGPVQKGDPVTGLDQVNTPGTHVIRAGVKATDKGEVTDGGRVACVVGVADSTGPQPAIREARELAYGGISAVRFPGMQCRTDIAERV